MSNTKINRSEQCLIDLKKGSPFFKFIPNDIGEFIYCDSTRGESKTGSYVLAGGILALGIFLLVCLFIFNLGDVKYWLGFMGILFLILGFQCFASISIDCDFIVGTSGARIIKYSGERVDKIEGVCFKDVDSCYKDRSIVREKYSNRITRTSYKLSFYGKRQCLFKYDYSRDIDVFFRYGCRVEKAWLEYKLAQYMEDLDQNRPVVFEIEIDDNKIQFSDSGLYVFGVFFAKDQISKFGFEGDYFFIEHSNFSSQLLGLIKNGYRFEIPKSKIANFILFRLFFNKFIEGSGYSTLFSDLEKVF